MAEIEALQSGVVLPLDRKAGGNLELFVGNVRLADIEVVVKDGWLYARVVSIRRPTKPEADGRADTMEHCNAQ